MSLAAAAADGDHQAVARLVGPGDPLWELHGDICRQYLAMGGESADALAEWAAVQRSP